MLKTNMPMHDIRHHSLPSACLQSQGVRKHSLAPLLNRHQSSHTRLEHKQLCVASEYIASHSSGQVSSDAGSISYKVVRTPFDLGGLQGLQCIAAILGDAFWERTSSDDQVSAMDIIGSRLYGIQLAAQLLWMHIVWFDSTVSILAVHTQQPGSTDDSQDSQSLQQTSSSIAQSALEGLVPYRPVEALSKLLNRRQRLQLSSSSDAAVEKVVGTAVLQLKVTGKELQDSCGCQQGQPVVIVSNVAVAKDWRGKGVGRSLMSTIGDAAVNIFCTAQTRKSSSVAQQQQQQAESASTAAEALLTPSALRSGVSQVQSSKAVQVLPSSGIQSVGSDDASMVQSAVTGQAGASSPIVTSVAASSQMRSSSAGSSSAASAGLYGSFWQTEPAVFLALIVYKYNNQAIRLYESCGWRHAHKWMDKVWEAEAEKGKPGTRPRRLLYIKTVDGVTPAEVLKTFNPEPVPSASPPTAPPNSIATEGTGPQTKQMQ